MSTERKLIVRLDAESRRKLQKGEYTLDLFRGSKTSTGTISTNVIRPISALGEKNTIRWKDSYAGYISPVTDNGQGTYVEAVTARNMYLGDLFRLNKEGNASIENGKGIAGKLKIENQSNECGAGYCFAIGGMAHESEPVCVVSIPGQSEIAIEPKNKYLLTFSSKGKIDPGVALVKVDSSACTVEYENDTTVREVWFNYKTGRWGKTEEEAAISVNTAVVTNGWFTFVQKGAAILNSVLNG